MSDLHRQICEAIAALGGRALLVGGCVRDRLLGITPLDIDCEVHGIEPDQLCQILSAYGEVDKSGERFGVFTLKEQGFDFALPRIERLTGSAHTDFDVTPIPSLTPREAAARRDFTVNAIMMDALTGEIIDPYGGADDLKRGVLRAVPGGQFHEDPLRVLRGAQFAARFHLWPDGDTLAQMRRMPLDTLSAQRVMSETKKALLQAEEPGVYVRILREAGAITPWFKELCADNALECAADMLDRAAALRDRAKEPLAFMLAAMTGALCKEDESALLARLGVNKSVSAVCASLTALYGETAACLAAGSGMERTHLLFDACACAHDLALLCIAGGADEARMTERLRAYEAAAARPMPTGRMLMEAGAKPGPHMKEQLSAARKKALLGMDAGEAVKQVLREEISLPQ